MSAANFRAKTIQKSSFTGVFSFYPHDYLKVWAAEQLQSVKSEWPIALCFNDMKKAVGCLSDGTNVQQAISPSYETKSDEAPLVLRFSELTEADDYYSFASSYGCLFGSRFNTQNDVTFESVDKIGLYSLFDYPEGKKAKAFTEKCLSFKENDVSKIHSVTYEFLADWINAINILKFGFLLNHLISSDFNIEQVDDLLFINNGEMKHAILLQDIGEGFYRVPLRLTPLTSKKRDIRINSESDYTTILNRNIEKQFEDYNKNESHRPLIKIDDFGYLKLTVKLSSTKQNKSLVTKENLRNYFKKIIETLISAHNVVMKLSIEDNSLVYVFDSLLASLWFQFSQLALSVNAIGVCEFCGKPFLARSKGYKKRFCSTLCRNKAKYRRNKA